MPVIPVLRRLKKEDCGFKANLTTWRDPGSKKQQKKQ
jgi:hypothetical protein